ncbi:MAG: gliding motility-associatede transport system auxiliary component [Acidimicrobiaceae bacterium]|nr:gliding motility-associatede transport system auxiliary component [Acidimicrobiaceae bacterium]
MSAFARRLAATAAALAVLFLAGVQLERHRTQFDLTADDHLTLSDQTRQVVKAVHSPTTIVVFLRRGEAGRAEAAALLSRYRRLNRRISFRVTDPDEAPGQVRRLNVDPALGGVAIAAGSRSEQVPLASEQDITAGLARLLRPGDATVCFATGHGEVETGLETGEGLSQAAGLLRVNGYKVETVDLLADPNVPARCRSLIVATPTAPLGQAGANMKAWLDGGGRVLFLADPVSTVDLNEVLGPYGLGLDRGIVLEGDDGSRLKDDPITLVLRDYRSASPIVRRLPPAVLPGAQAVSQVDVDQNATVAVARSSAKSYLERQPGQPSFDPATDRPGPLVVAATVEQPRNEGGRIVRPRLAVIGDVDFATNSFLGEAGNSRLFIQTVDWLTLRSDLVSVDPNIPDFRPLELTRSRLGYARLLSGVVVPGLFLLAGALVWAVRRTR